MLICLHKTKLFLCESGLQQTLAIHMYDSRIIYVLQKKTIFLFKTIYFSRLEKLKR